MAISFCDLFLLFFFLFFFFLLRNGERREVGGEAEGKMHGLYINYGISIEHFVHIIAGWCQCA